MGIFRQLMIQRMNENQYCSYLRRKGMIIGEDCVIGRDVYYGSEPYLIKIGNHVRINSGVRLITHDGGRWILKNTEYGLFGEEFTELERIEPIIIDNNVFIGFDAIIMPGVKIGESSVIGTGALVTKNVPSGTIVGGVPAKVIETLDTYAQKMRERGLKTKLLDSGRKRDYLVNFYRNQL
ncbi:MAG: acyltransferase [Synergistaceae bacterium]|nr:acyltransferase [Synergistaceae bacterium]